MQQSNIDALKEMEEKISKLPNSKDFLEQIEAVRLDAIQNLNNQAKAVFSGHPKEKGMNANGSYAIHETGMKSVKVELKRNPSNLENYAAFPAGFMTDHLNVTLLGENPPEILSISQFQIKFKYKSNGETNAFAIISGF